MNCHSGSPEESCPLEREVAQEKVQLIPDRKNYAGGEVAEILVQSPFAPAEGVLTIRRSGLLRTERFTMTKSSYTLRLPLVEAMTPNVYVQVDLVGAAVRVDDEGNALADLPKRPAFASGEIKLDIPPSTRRLSVTATPREKVLEPGAETLVDVEVKDANGRSVAGTDTAVIVVDESVLALTNYQLTDPLAYFYAERKRRRKRLSPAGEIEVGEPGGSKHLPKRIRGEAIEEKQIQTSSDELPGSLMISWPSHRTNSLTQWKLLTLRADPDRNISAAKLQRSCRLRRLRCRPMRAAMRR